MTTKDELAEPLSPRADDAGDASVSPETAPATLGELSSQTSASEGALAESDDDTRPLLATSPLRATTGIIAVLLAALSCGLMFWHTKDSAIRNTNVGSRYATVEALVNHGTFAINDTQYKRTIDKVMLDGKYYSSKPPLLSTMAAGVYATYRTISGHDIRTHEKKVVKLVNVVFGCGLQLLLFGHFYALMLLFVRKMEAALAALAALGFAYLGVGYAIELTEAHPGAALALASFYWACRVHRGAKLGMAVRPWHYTLSGLFAGLLPGLSLPGGAISAAVFLYLAAHDWRSTLKFFVPGALPGVLAHFLLTYLSSGSLVPVYLRPGAYDYPGSYWRQPRGIDALQEPKYLYAFHLLLGHHGLFSMTPAFIFSAIALVQVLRKKGELTREALVVAGASGVMTLFFIFRTSNYGGNCVGFRWAIVYMPLLLVFFAVWIDRTRMRWWLWALVAGALLVAQYHVHDAFWTPWHTARWHTWFAQNILR